jgi:hypothetical protein
VADWSAAPSTGHRMTEIDQTYYANCKSTYKKRFLYKVNTIVLSAVFKGFTGDNKKLQTKYKRVWNFGIGKVLLMLVTNVTIITGIYNSEHDKIFYAIKRKKRNMVATDGREYLGEVLLAVSDLIEVLPPEVGGVQFRVFRNLRIK